MNLQGEMDNKKRRGRKMLHVVGIVEKSLEQWYRLR
jgi:hypothetical protein